MGQEEDFLVPFPTLPGPPTPPSAQLSSEPLKIGLHCPPQTPVGPQLLGTSTPAPPKVLPQPCLPLPVLSVAPG